MQRVPSIGYRLANSRWRPTLPPPQPLSAATRGLGRWALFQFGFGVGLAMLDGVLVLLMRSASPAGRVAILHVVFIPMIALVAVAAAVSGGWTWRQASSALRGDRT